MYNHVHVNIKKITASTVFPIIPMVQNLIQGNINEIYRAVFGIFIISGTLGYHKLWAPFLGLCTTTV